MSLTWYQRDIRAAIKGMTGLTLEERGAYTTIVDHQYLMGGPLPDDDRYISGILGCDMRVWRRLKAELVNKKRITISDAHIADARAIGELARLQARRNQRAASGQLGGISSGVSRRNKDLREAPASTPSNQRRGQEIRGDLERRANAPPNDVLQVNGDTGPVKTVKRRSQLSEEAILTEEHFDIARRFGIAEASVSDPFDSFKGLSSREGKQALGLDCRVANVVPESHRLREARGFVQRLFVKGATCRREVGHPPRDRGIQSVGILLPQAE